LFFVACRTYKKVHKTQSLQTIHRNSVSNLNPELNFNTGLDTCHGPISSIASCSGGSSFKRKKNLSASGRILAAMGDRLAEVKEEENFDLFAKKCCCQIKRIKK
jgi:hypothetical protein